MGGQIAQLRGHWAYTGTKHEGIVLEAVLRAWGAGMLLAGVTWLRARLWRPA